MLNQSQIDRKIPYVEFKRVKYNTDIKNYGEVTEQVEVVQVRVDGCHGQVNNLNEMIKRGMKCTGSGNLVPGKHTSLIAWVDTQSGAGLHPLLKEQSVVDQRIKEASERRTGKN